MTGTSAVRPAEPDEYPHLQAIDIANLRPFREIGLELPDERMPLDSFARTDAVLVIGRPSVGFALIDRLDGVAYLAEISVHPNHARAGLGTVLLDAVIEWAGARYLPAVTLTTFRDVPWNGPWYRRHGFVELPEDTLPPGLRAHRDDERARGLDRVGPRVAMQRDLNASIA